MVRNWKGEVELSTDESGEVVETPEPEDNVLFTEGAVEETTDELAVGDGSDEPNFVKPATVDSTPEDAVIDIDEEAEIPVGDTGEL